MIGTDREVEMIIKEIKDFRKVLEDESISRGLRKIVEI